MNRHEQRIKTFQLIFQLDENQIITESTKFKDVYDEQEYVKMIVDHFIKNIESIDALISTYLQNFTIDRISKVERSLLRMAFCELQIGETPQKVVINETVILAKSYGDNDSFKFINGVLKNFIKSEHL